MKKSVIPVIITLMITLIPAGCGGVRQDSQAALDIRAYYVKAGSITLNAAVSADYGGRVYGYKLGYAGTGTRGELTVIEPAVIEGVTAVIEDGEVRLISEDALIDTGAIAGKDVSPVKAFALMIDAWQNGYITSSYGEKYVDGERTVYCIVMEIQMTDSGVSLKTWFDAETFEPVRGEIYNNGYCVITVVFE